MVKSMTSFGRASNDEGNKYLFSVEMKSVNSRYLDVNVRIPKSYIALEEEIRKLINSKLSRGKVDVFINQKNYSQGDGVCKLNVKLAESYYNALKEIEETLNVKNDITVTQIARFPEVISIVEEEESLEEIWSLIKPLIISSLEMMEGMRVTEGEKLKEYTSSSAGIVHMCFKVDDIKEEYNRIKSLGYDNFKRKNSEEIYKVENGYLFKIIAPEGTKIEFRDSEI